MKTGQEVPEGTGGPLLGRRGLLRGGVAAATVAGLGIGATVLNAPSAAAADGDPVELGMANESTATTAVTITSGTGDPDNATLSLTNEDGPSLFLNPLAGDWPGTLKLGEIANTTIGPSIGLDDGDGGVDTGYLLTDQDLAFIPTTLAITPTRIVDLRSAAGRTSIIDSAPGAFDSQHRLVAGKWMDVKISNLDDDAIYIESLFVTLTVAGPLKPGFLTLYPKPDDNTQPPPTASNLNWVTGQVVANLAFTAVGVDDDSNLVVRIYTSATTFVIVDINGLIITPVPAGAAMAARVKARRLAQRQATAKLKTAAVKALTRQ